MKLLVIGKAKKPRSFKGTEMENLPVDYYNQKRARMNREIFENWFKTKWVSEVRDILKSKGLLDNAPSHPNETLLKSNDGIMIVKFLPPNVTGLIQPMDQGVISSVKRLCRANLLKTLANEDDGLIIFWKRMSTLNAIHGIAKSWPKVKPITLVRSWRKILPNVEIDLSECEEIEASDISLSEICGLMENLTCFENVDRKTLRTG